MGYMDKYPPPRGLGEGRACRPPTHSRWVRMVWQFRALNFVFHA